MTTKKEIEESLDLIKQKFDDPKLKARFSSFSKNMQFTFTDLNTAYLMRVTNGEVESLKEESIDSPDIHVTIESGILIDFKEIILLGIPDC